MNTLFHFATRMLTCLCAVIPVCSIAETAKEMTAEKEAAWSALSAPIEGVATRRDAAQRWGRSSAEFEHWSLATQLQYRERGVAYFDQYPDDEKFEEWFIRTRREAWDEETPGHSHAHGVWDKRLLTYETRFLASSRASEKQKFEFRDRTLSLDFAHTFDRIALTGGNPAEKLQVERPLLKRLFRDLLDLAQHSDQKPSSVQDLFTLAEHDPEFLQSALSALQASPNEEVRRDATDRREFYRRFSEPVQLSLPGLRGPPIDLSAFRGKVVLLTFWDVGCLGCIASMPDFESLHQKYHNADFEMIGVCFLGLRGEAKIDEERQRAKELLHKQHATYRNAELNPFATGHTLEDDPVLKRFGAGGGSTFLFDQQGRLVATAVRGGWKEYYIRKLLGLSP